MQEESLKFILFIQSVLFLPLVSFAGKYADPVKEYSLDQVMQKYQTISANLQATIVGPVRCTEINKSSGENECSFKKFCKVLDKNRNNPYLYINKEGFKIPNYQLHSIERSINRCYLNVKKQFKKVKDDAIGEEENPQLTAQRTILKARLSLLKTIREEKFEKEFNSFEEHIVLSKIENLEKEPDNLMFEKPEMAGLEKQISKIEADSGVKLPRKVRTKYIASIMSFYPDAPTPPNKKRGTREILKNPFIEPRLSWDIHMAGGVEEVLENQIKIDKAYARSTEIFLEVKKGILKLLNKRIAQDPGLKAQYQKMITRIGSIRYEILNPHPRVLHRFCPAPNAYYDGQSHNFVLCPQILEYPKAGIKAIMAHELMHAIDPCLIAMPMKRISDIKYKAKYKQTPEARKLQLEKNQKRAKKRGAIHYAREKIEYDDLYTVDLDNSTQEAYNWIASDYKVTPFGGTILFKDNPATKTITCLKGEKSLGATGSNKEQSKKSLDDAIQRMVDSGATDKNPEYLKLLAAKKKFDKTFDQFGACSFLPGNSQLQEAWSDWGSGEIIGDDLSKIGDADKLQYAFESFGFFLALGCETDPPDMLKQSIKYRQDMGCMEKEEGQMSHISTIRAYSGENKDSHSYSIDRVQKIFISHPEIKKALGCSETAGGVHCE